MAAIRKKTTAPTGKSVVLDPKEYPSPDAMTIFMGNLCRAGLAQDNNNGTYSLPESTMEWMRGIVERHALRKQGQL